jgi:uncharacterized membrane protein YciS (DUF1049 family)
MNGVESVKSISVSGFVIDFRISTLVGGIFKSALISGLSIFGVLTFR